MQGFDALPLVWDDSRIDELAQLVHNTVVNYLEGFSVDVDAFRVAHEAEEAVKESLIDALVDGIATPYQCQNCDRLWSEDSLKPIKHLSMRVAPGEPMPAGECPVCGALCYEMPAVSLPNPMQVAESD